MARGSTRLDNPEYDKWLAKNKKGRELKARHAERKGANKGYRGWHFGLGDNPVYTKDKGDFQRALKERGLMMKDDVRKKLR